MNLQGQLRRHPDLEYYKFYGFRTIVVHVRSAGDYGVRPRIALTWRRRSRRRFDG